MGRWHCTWALLAVFAGATSPALAQSPAPAQQPAAGATTSGFIVFIRGAAVGREDVTTKTSAQGTVISGSARLAPPIDISTRRVEIRYQPDWTPESLVIEATIQGHPITLNTAFKGTDAVVDITEGDTKTTETDKVSPQTVVVPNLFFGSYEALAQRLRTATVGASIPAYLAPEAEIPIRVRAIHAEQVQAGKTIFAVRRFDLAIANPGGDVLMQLSEDEAGHLVRLTVPGQSLDIVREDAAASTSRTISQANPGDEAITIPAYGFNIAATMTRPKTPAAKLPAVVLLSGSAAGDRDSVVAGVPIMTQLAGALADAGFLVVRFDRRGFGQSGGRAEGATLGDSADDARTVVRYLRDRKEVDGKRIALVGHSEGAWVALLAASREGKVAAVVSIAGSSSTGGDLVLEQQRHILDLMKVPDADRQTKIALQKQIHAAVVSGTGWEGVPTPVRKQAETPWFQSLLTYDPAKVLKNVDQPLLIVQGQLDQEVPAAHADRLGELAKRVSHSKGVEVVLVRGVNHLLVSASTGELDEYGALTDLNISADVTKTITGWLSKTLVGR